MKNYSISNEEIGRRLRELRGDKSISIVAHAVGISPSTLGMYEQGLRVPRDRIKVLLADYYKTTVQRIFFDEK